jgi:hypothetical protein
MLSKHRTPRQLSLHPTLELESQESGEVRGSVIDANGQQIVGFIPRDPYDLSGLDTLKERFDALSEIVLPGRDQAAKLFEYVVETLRTCPCLTDFNYD